MLRRFQFRPERFGADFVVMKMHRMTFDRLGAIERSFFGNPNHGYLCERGIVVLDDINDVTQLDVAIGFNTLKQIRRPHAEYRGAHEEDNQLT